MSDALLDLIRQTLPAELQIACSGLLDDIDQCRFENLLSKPLVKLLLGHEDDERTREVTIDKYADWNDYVFERLEILLAKRQADDSEKESETPAYRQHLLFLVAVAALQAFLQSNITGPPLSFSSSDVIFAKSVQAHLPVSQVRKNLVASLSLDGEAAYTLTPNVELICLADTILTCPPIKKNIKAYEWVKLRRDFTHQRLLSEISSTLETSIYHSLASVQEVIQNSSIDDKSQSILVSYVLERVCIHIHHGHDQRARTDLSTVSKARRFEFALTGFLGKRTKYQDRDVSQLTILAKSYEYREENGNPDKDEPSIPSIEEPYKPSALDLNDDTLLESISFTERPKLDPGAVQDSNLPRALATLDPSSQPLLQPLDSITLLLVASSITNTSPSDGLTREETLPYAIRVLEGGSSNWQVYTQALLLRSRIEGYQSRTTERGLLQLQALVDQVIAETSGSTSTANNVESASTFLPRSEKSESAPVRERLRYIHQLCTPFRWVLEAELAARWVHVGGLRSALEIYERLELWPEAALCLAATEREDKAEQMIRKQLFHATNGNDETHVDEEDEKWQGAEREPPPSDAPRLYCILGDINRDASMYEKAWDLSNGRYARAQRSLGRLYYSKNEFVNAAGAYSKSLKMNPLNQTSWFALGCALLELAEFERAADAFTRTVQLDETDAEAWSNLAAALLKLGTTTSDKKTNDSEQGDATLEDDAEEDSTDPQRYNKDALKALKRAAALKRDSARIWDNLLTVAASIDPPPYSDIVIAQERVIALRGSTEGENCVDATILRHLVRHVVSTYLETSANGTREEVKGLARLVSELVDKHVTPLITESSELWQIVATLALWRNQPGKALAAHEKAWRAITVRQNDIGTQHQWEVIVSATLDLCDAYESLGPRERTEGLAAGTGELVAKDWKFKARSAVRGIMGKGKGTWEDSEGWSRLRDRLDELKG